MASAVKIARDHAVELAHMDIGSQIDELRKLRAQLPEFEGTARKEFLQTRIQRLVPGSTAPLQAMADSCGAVVTDPSSMATLLNNHWGEVFSPPP